MIADSVARFAAAVRSHQLLDEGQLRSLTEDFLSPFPSAHAFGEELIRRGWLTEYQVGQIGRGHAGDLVMGAYVLLAPLGQGGMGQVFLARHRALGRKVALKVIRPDRLAGDPDRLRQYVERFQREAKAAARLDHPNIVTVYDAGEANGQPFFVMRYVEGTDLGDLVRRQGPLPVHVACEYVRQAALGLQEAHEHGLVHRDIKPANLLLCKETGQVKIMDLGLVRRSEDGLGTTADETAPGMILGTPDYMAPEQSADAHGADIRADLYSLGCTLFSLLTGTVPFPGGDLAHKAYCHRHEPPPSVRSRRADVPAEVDAIVRKLLAKQPEQRYQSPAELAAALVPWANGDATVPMAALPRRTSRRWLLIPVLAIPVILLAVLLPRLLPPGTRATPADTGSDGDPGIAIKVDKTSPQTKTPRSNEVRVLGQLKEYKGHAGHVSFVGFSSDGKYALSGDGFGLVLVTALSGGVQKFRATFPGRVCDIQWNGDAGRALWSGSLKHELSLVELPAKKEAVKFSTDGGRVTWATLSSDGKRMVSIDDKGLVRLWDAASGQALGTLDGHAGAVDMAVFSADGGRVLTGGNDAVPRLWDVETRKEVAKLTPKPNARSWVACVALSPDGRLAVAGAGSNVVVWDVGTRQQLRAWKGHDTRVSALAFTPDSKWLLTGGWDRMLRLWDVETGAELARFEGHTQMVQSVAVSPDGRYALSGAADGTARLWAMPD